MTPPNINDVPCMLPDLLRPLADEVIANVRRQVAAMPQIVPMAYVINTAKAQEMPIEMDMRDEAAKDNVSQIIRMFAQDMQADMVIMVTEGWGVPENERHMAQQILRKWGSFAAYPHHVDTIMVHIETTAGVWTAQTTIWSANGKRHRSFGELKFWKADHAEGRLTNFIAANRIRAQETGKNMPGSEYYKP